MQTPDKNYCYLLRHKNPKYKSLTYNGFTNNSKKNTKDIDVTRDVKCISK